MKSIPKTADSDVKVEIDPNLWHEEKAHKNHFEEFECSICLNIVWEPKACAGCQKVYCAKCILAVLRNNNKCP